MKIEINKEISSICQIINCAKVARYFLFTFNKFDKSYCSYHVKELMFNENYCFLLYLLGTEIPDERCRGFIEEI